MNYATNFNVPLLIHIVVCSSGLNNEIMNNETVYWTMKNGEKIDVDKMTENHLRNTLKMILRKVESMQETCPHNVEMAIDLAEQENSEPFCDDWMWK